MAADYSKLEAKVDALVSRADAVFGRADSFSEADHPRAADGKFGSGGGAKKAEPQKGNTLTNIGALQRPGNGSHTSHAIEKLREEDRQKRASPSWNSDDDR